MLPKGQMLRPKLPCVIMAVVYLALFIIAKWN